MEHNSVTFFQRSFTIGNKFKSLYSKFEALNGVYFIKLSHIGLTKNDIYILY